MTTTFVFPLNSICTIKIAVLEAGPCPICEMLIASGFTCQAFQRETDIAQKLRQVSYNLLIVDAQIPSANWLDVLRYAKNHIDKKNPAICVTELSNGDHIVDGLTAGADDYLLKPFRHHELVERVRAQLRRVYPIKSAIGTMAFHDYVFDLSSYCVTLAGDPIDMTKREFDLGLLLFRNLDIALSRKCILDLVWPEESDAMSTLVDIHISRLRRKLCLKPKYGYKLSTAYGQYRLVKYNITVHAVPLLACGKHLYQRAKMRSFHHADFLYTAKETQIPACD